METTREDFDRGSVEHRDTYLRWFARHGITTAELAHDGVVCQVSGTAVTVFFADGHTTTIEETALENIPELLRGRM